MIATDKVVHSWWFHYQNKYLAFSRYHNFDFNYLLITKNEHEEHQTTGWFQFFACCQMSQMSSSWVCQLQKLEIDIKNFVMLKVNKLQEFHETQLSKKVHNTNAEFFYGNSETGTSQAKKNWEQRGGTSQIGEDDDRKKVKWTQLIWNEISKWIRKKKFQISYWGSHVMTKVDKRDSLDLLDKWNEISKYSIKMSHEFPESQLITRLKLNESKIMMTSWRRIVWIMIDQKKIMMNLTVFLKHKMKL